MKYFLHLKLSYSLIDKLNLIHDCIVVTALAQETARAYMFCFNLSSYPALSGLWPIAALLRNGVGAGYEHISIFWTSSVMCNWSVVMF